MRHAVTVFGLVLWALAPSDLRAEDKPAPKAESVVDYASKTHGAVEVKSAEEKPADYFDVLLNGKRAFPGNPKLLNNSVELTPGTYVVDVNKTRKTVSVEAGKKTVLWTGELVVEGDPSGPYWYPMQGKERRLAGNPPVLNRARSFFPGTYTVFVHVGVGTKDKNLGDAEVKAGEKKVLKH
jgi:hypothetical protein